MLPVRLEDVETAAERLRGQVVRTPVFEDHTLADRGVTLWLKAENLQHIGAFKARGALNAVGQLPAEVRARGLITYSSGNHAQAVALAAKHFGVPATIAMPVDAPKVKVASVRSLGATIVFAGTTSNDRKQKAEAIAAKTGGPIIQPFDHPHIVAGAGTASLELADEVAARTDGAGLDALVIPVGGGGLLAGACVVAQSRGIAVYTAEPVGCDAMAQSLAAGERVPVEPGPTIGDGLKPVMVGALNFEIARQVVRGSYRVDDGELGHALVTILQRHKVLVEPSGGAALAVALRETLPEQPRHVGVLLSGGNVDPALVAQLLQTHAA
ncbi:MAG: threonine/serine dehydratase [Myxococcota bacterium]